jgi:hypothetical protein
LLSTHAKQPSPSKTILAHMNKPRPVQAAAFMLAAVCQTLLSAQAPLPEYATNSPAITLSVDGTQGDAFTPANAMVWVGGQSEISLVLGAGFQSAAVMGFDPEGIVSRSTGATVTTGGQLINLPLSIGFVVANVSGNVSLSIPTGSPANYGFQALVVDPTHPDGYRLSAPVVVRVQIPVADNFSSSVSMDRLESHIFTVHEALGFRLPVANSPALQIGQPSNIVEGSVTLTSPTLGTITREVLVDGVSLLTSSDSGTVSNMHDLFPVSIPGEQGIFSATFTAGVGLTAAGLTWSTMTNCNFKTDTGVSLNSGITKGPIRQPNGNPMPLLTAAQANQVIQANDPGLTTNRVADPSNSSQCHSYTFLPANVASQKSLWGAYVDSILLLNGYAVRPKPKVGDVAIYRGPNEIFPLHSGVVTAVDATTCQVTEITSQWGQLGTFRHAPLAVPSSYKPQGFTITYYGSARAGGNTVQTQP